MIYLSGQRGSILPHLRVASDYAGWSLSLIVPYCVKRKRGYVADLDEYKFGWFVKLLRIPLWDSRAKQARLGFRRDEAML